jgi:hypothetical protein
LKVSQNNLRNKNIIKQKKQQAIEIAKISMGRESQYVLLLPSLPVVAGIKSFDMYNDDFFTIENSCLNSHLRLNFMPRVST